MASQTPAPHRGRGAAAGTPAEVVWGRAGGGNRQGISRGGSGAGPQFRESRAWRTVSTSHNPNAELPLEPDRTQAACTSQTPPAPHARGFGVDRGRASGAARPQNKAEGAAGGCPSGGRKAGHQGRKRAELCSAVIPSPGRGLGLQRRGIRSSKKLNRPLLFRSHCSWVGLTVRKLVDGAVTSNSKVHLNRPRQPSLNSDVATTWCMILKGKP